LAALQAGKLEGDREADHGRDGGHEYDEQAEAPELAQDGDEIHGLGSALWGAGLSSTTRPIEHFFWHFVEVVVEGVAARSRCCR
jgi:hypothetical protein